MTAHELAHKLLDGPDLMVTRNGYEGGVLEITTINEPKSLSLNVHEEWYYGQHEYDYEDLLNEHTNDIIEVIQAIHIK